jgi:4-alpha-glucanotransferase
MEKSRTTDAWGIDEGYVDIRGAEHLLTPETRAALSAAMGVNPAGKPAPEGGAFADVIVRRGAATWAPDDGGELKLEDGSSKNLDAHEQVTLPNGYHAFTARGAERPTRLIVAPRQCRSPEARQWGWSAQLYAARSRASWGIGDLADLRRLAEWSRELGANVLMVNPLTAVTPVPPLEASPYYPSSRRFRNPLYVRVEEAPGAQSLGAELERLANEGRALNAQRRINRDTVFALKMHALERCFAGFGQDAGFDAFRAAQGLGLQQFATYCAIAEREGKDWRRWPASLRRPDGEGVAAFVREHERRVTFHAWLQWVLDNQLAAASSRVALIQDLPIGLDAAGADAWCWQELLAKDVSVGAPLDELNPAGQDWGLTPFVPHHLRAAGYTPFIETIRATLRHAGGLRIDHVMGLFRLFWIPRGAGPQGGGFVRPRVDELLAIVALESERAGAFVIGEDLGTVEDGVREKLADHGVLSYRLACFEPGPPREYPELALTSVTTHDLPTIAGLWTKSDLARCKAAGVAQNEGGVEALRTRLATLAGGATADTLPLAEVIEKVHAALAAAPSRILLATLDDALAVEERPNLPGAPADFPNWSMALPLPLDDLAAQDLPRRVAHAITRR